MQIINSLFFKLITACLLLNASFCLASDNKSKEETAKEEAAAAKKRQEYLEDIKAKTPEQHCQYGSGSIGIEADKEMGNYFAAQAEYWIVQSNSLNSNNYYTFTKDSLGIISQLVAPAVSSAITPILIEARQKLYKTDAETKAEEDAERQRKALESLNQSQIKEREAEELAQLAIGLNHACGQSISLSVQGQKDCQSIFDLYLERVKAATDDLKKRQEATNKNTNRANTARSKL